MVLLWNERVNVNVQLLGLGNSHTLYAILSIPIT